ncbi:MAG TPA: ribosomal-processing cysteine protease Prp [Bacillota bacterium]|nr:ribosomal-processing cysteine protease Prp [Bacillota bacterium]HPT87643.1 ribosomal-processing cysteine protease Prp [Bacillota bacterium]
MVRITLYRDGSNHYIGFDCSGHADFAEAGSDIVCAGISALTQTTILALDRLVGLDMDVQADQKTGRLRCLWTNQPVTVDKSDLLIQTMMIGLKEIQNLFPEHLSLSETEVLSNDSI